VPHAGEDTEALTVTEIGSRDDADHTLRRPLPKQDCRR
jgi:hypothetical protein